MEINPDSNKKNIQTVDVRNKLVHIGVYQTSPIIGGR